jgi:hypothetical protein
VNVTEILVEVLGHLDAQLHISSIVIDTEELPLVSLQTQLLYHGVQAQGYVLAGVPGWKGGHIRSPPEMERLREWEIMRSEKGEIR